MAKPIDTPKRASDINWDNSKYPANHSVDYSPAAKTAMQSSNVGHHSFVEYVGQLKSGNNRNWHKFLVSMNSSGCVLTGSSDLVALPCPDFCTMYEPFALFMSEVEELKNTIMEIRERVG